MPTHVARRSRDARSWRLVLGIGAVTVMVLSTTSPAGAGDHDHDDGDRAETVQVSGNAVPSECNDGRGAGAIELTGDLEGCLTFFPKDFTCEELNGFALYNERGREVFEGSLNGESGKFRTKYTLEATYTQGSCAAFDAGGFPFLNQLTGGCDHFVKGRNGVFDDARGLITFHDVIPEPGVSGASNFLYSGHIDLDD